MIWMKGCVDGDGDGIEMIIRLAHFVNFTQDGTESRRECVALFGEQGVPGLRTLQTGFGVCQGHPCWKD
jgi:hypothetical protein